MKKPVLRRPLWAVLWLLCLTAAVRPVLGQVGYISVHVKALNEESSPSFPFSITGGPTAVAPFSLTGVSTSLKCSDIGGSHGGTGSGQLWVIAGALADSGANGVILYRRPGQNGWVAIGDSASAIDGAGADQSVYVTAHGFVVAYKNGARDTLYYPANHTGYHAVDVGNNASLVSGSGVTVITDQRGHLLGYQGSYANKSDHWLDLSAANPAIPAHVVHVDINVTNDNILFSAATKAYILDQTGAVTSLGAPGNKPTNQDVAFDDNGNIFCLANTSATGGDGVYAWKGGTTWQSDSTSRNIQHITGGALDELWGINERPTVGGCKSVIFTKTTDASRFWFDNEWINTKGDNTFFIPVAPGDYTVAESTPSHWACQAISVFDPTGISTAATATASASVHITPGKVVTIGFQNGLIQPANIPKVCAYAIQQDFGTGIYTNGPPLTGLTDYHFMTATSVQDGYYSLAKTTSNAWGNKNLVDHTTGTGYFMIINASYAKDQFYRERVTGLVPGLQYTLSAFLANLSPSYTLKPNVLFGISDTSGMLLGSLSSGDIVNTSWKQYSFTFTASTTEADIFLSNNSIGGSGNDLALDDIAFSPIPKPVAPIKWQQSSDTVCLGSKFTLSDSTVDGTWSTLDPSTVSVDNQGHVTALGGGSGRIMFQTVNSIGCTAADTAIVHILPEATTADMHIQPQVICTGDSVTLRAATATVQSPVWSWYTDSTLLHLADTGVAFPTHRLTATTTYYVTLSGANRCVNLPGAEAKIPVTVNPYPVVPALASPGLLCAGSSKVLQNTPPGGVWQAVPAAAASIDSTTGRLTGIQAGDALVTYTVTNPGGCATAVTLTVPVQPVPALDSIYGPHQLCQGTNIDLGDSTAGGTWGLSDGGVAAIDQAGHLSGLSAGDITATYAVTGPNGCQAIATAPVSIQVAPPQPTITTGNVPTVCEGRAMQLGSTPGGAYRYEWYQDGNLVAQVSTDTMSTTHAGMYTTVAYTSAGCASPVSAPIEVSSRCAVTDLADLAIRKTVSAGPYSVTQPVTYTLTIVNNGPGRANEVVVQDTLSVNLGVPGNYGGPSSPYYDLGARSLYWQIPALDAGDSVTLTYDISLEALNLTSNTAYVSARTPDPDLSNNSATAVIRLESDLFIPNAVSPNGDGKNDRFLIVGLERYPGSSLNVFNRWGGEVYHSDNYANNWDGHELSDGTYFYVLLLNTPHGKQAYKGWVEILHK